jgi:hypothetical protein
MAGVPVRVNIAVKTGDLTVSPMPAEAPAKTSEWDSVLDKSQTKIRP